MILYTKKELINKLNSFINNYDSLKILCDILDNDIDRVNVYIDRIITFAYNNPQKFMKEARDLVDSYYFVLDDGVRFKVDDKFSDKVNLPSVDLITEICTDNINVKKENELREQERNNYYLNLMKFNEVGMVYTRPELVKINPQFNYYYATSKDDKYYDYYDLYNDERYKDDSSDNPLNNSYFSNLQSIKEDNNIQLSKYNDLYMIENGRHRLLYVLFHSKKEEEIPCIVTRRIENRDFNIFTHYLKKKFGAYIYKNNIFNDDLDIIIVLHNKLYKITDMKQLAEFIKYVDDQDRISKYYVSDFNMNNSTDMTNVKKYIKELISIYNEEGYDFLNQDFSDLLERFRDYNDEDFCKAFYLLKYYYLKNLVYNKQDKIFDDDLVVVKNR